MRVARPTALLSFFVLGLALLPSWVAAQNLEFHAPANAADPTTPKIMRDLAQRAIPVYHDDDRARYLANLSALQLASGDYAAAYAARLSLRELRRTAASARPIDRSMVYDMYARAKALEVETRVPFAQAFAQSFRNVFSSLNDLDAYVFASWLQSPPPLFQDALQRAFDQRRAKDTISLNDAVDLIWTHLAFDAYRNFAPLVDALVAEDDRRRYVIDDNIVVKTSDGASISAMLFRPRSATKPLPTLLEFTIYVSAPNYAKECAARGYAGVVAYTRGKRNSSGPVVPYEHDGNDARAVINWIAKQPWSDGRVGMYGADYAGFTEWAAAKVLPPALRAIAASSALGPGTDVPMAGNIFLNSSYRSLSKLTVAKGPDLVTDADEARWRSLDQAWYTSGKRYRDLDRLATEKPDPIFRRWLQHPGYDSYWQKLTPYRKDFARIDIPVLATTGYYDPSATSTLRYFTQHHLNNPTADQTLLIGPYDHLAMQRGPVSLLRGYQLDATALVDLHELRYQWFDYVLRGATKPSILKDSVNYQVMGTNEWRHASSLDAMANTSLRLYLDPTQTGDLYRLSDKAPPLTATIRQSVNFADRSDAGWTAPSSILTRNLPLHNSLAFVSDPLPQAIELSGVFSAQFDLTLNKQDVDLSIALYEQLPSGEYFQLFDPPYEFRASYTRDPTQRRLLKPGKRQRLTFKGARVTSRKLQQGSRLVMVLSVNKRPDEQINYGTGRDVSDESITDAKTPLDIRWHGGSYIDIPVWR